GMVRRGMPDRRIRIGAPPRQDWRPVEDQVAGAGNAHPQPRAHQRPAGTWTAAPCWARVAARPPPEGVRTPVPAPARHAASHPVPDRIRATACAAVPAARATPHYRPVALRQARPAVRADTAGGPDGQPNGTAPAAAPG